MGFLDKIGLEVVTYSFGGKDSVVRYGQIDDVPVVLRMIHKNKPKEDGPGRE